MEVYLTSNAKDLETLASWDRAEAEWQSKGHCNEKNLAKGDIVLCCMVMCHVPNWGSLPRAGVVRAVDIPTNGKVQRQAVRYLVPLQVDPLANDDGASVSTALLEIDQAGGEWSSEQCGVASPILLYY